MEDNKIFYRQLLISLVHNGEDPQRILQRLLENLCGETYEEIDRERWWNS